MVEADLIILQGMIQKAVANADTFNKVWVAGAAVIVSLSGVLLGSASQFLISYWQRKTQENLAQRQVDEQKATVSQQLAMQETASRRIAAANISAKRQVWIDKLREEISEYLAIWRDIAWRWDAIIIEAAEKEITDERIIEFKNPIVEKRFVAYQIKIRVQLRLNMKELKHKNLFCLMEDLESEIGNFNRSTSTLPGDVIRDKVQIILNNITSISREILKEEWERVKSDAFSMSGESVQ